MREWIIFKDMNNLEKRMWIWIKQIILMFLSFTRARDYLK